MRNPIVFLQVSIVAISLGFGHTGAAAQRELSAGYKLPDDPAAAWAEVDKVHRALLPPAGWQTNAPTPEEVVQFQKQVGETATSFANKAEEFIQRFPTNENIGDARITVVDALNHAVAAGDANAEKRIKEFVTSVLADKRIPEDDRAEVLMFSGNTAIFKKVGMRLFTEGMSKLNAEFESNWVNTVQEALKQFPTNSMVYTMLVSLAQRADRDRQKALAKDILNAPGAPPGVRTLAGHLLKGTKPYEVGKPLDIKFTALDGREVDVAKLKGKVVLVEFWSTWCGPCVAEMPQVKAAYQKFHDRGFEVVAISLDDKESVLRRFIKEKDLPWPQYFDGKGWENKFALRYGIFSIPTMWLVNKPGNLISTEARFDLEQEVASLLDAKSPSGE